MPPAPIKRRGLLGLILSLPIFSHSSEPGSPSFELVPQPRPGEEMRMDFERRTERNGAVLQWYRTPLHLQVAQVDPDGSILLHWTEGPATILAADPQRRPILETGLAVMHGVTLAVRLDARGQVRSLDNVAEVRHLCLEMIDRLSTSMAPHTASGPIVAAFLPALKAAFATEPVVAAASLREPHILLGAMGRRFDADEAVQFPTALDNPFGGPPIAAIAKFSIRRVQPRSHRAELGWLMVSDPVATTAAVRPALEGAATIAAAMSPDATAPAVPAAPPIDLQERGDFVVDTQSAWPISVSHTRRASVGPHLQVQTHTFTRHGA